MSLKCIDCLKKGGGITPRTPSWSLFNKQLCNCSLSSSIFFSIHISFIVNFFNGSPLQWNIKYCLSQSVYYIRLLHFFLSAKLEWDFIIEQVSTFSLFVSKCEYHALVGQISIPSIDLTWFNLQLNKSYWHFHVVSFL